MNTAHKTLAALTLLGMALTAQAAVGDDEAKQLGATLTAFGAEKAGNKDGTIPEYTGGVTTPPAGYKAGSGTRPDPFAADKPLFSITNANLAQYADKLSDGQKALFKKYADYRMDVYPTRRSAAFPKTVLDNTVKNATRCKTLEGGLALATECRGGLPFPIMKTGEEAMWNHLLHFHGYRYDFRGKQYLVDSAGRVVNTDEFTAQQEWPYYMDEAPNPDIYYRVRSDKLQTRSVGVINTYYDYLNPVATGRRAWSYAPGQRRVRVAPDFTYDTPTDSSGGVETFDDITLFSGKLDRFDFKLAGKKEMILPYNNYQIQLTKADELLKPNFMNPDKVRWELHRAWVVESTLKAGKRHLYSKRNFYWDEDWAAGMVDVFDANGKIWRVKFGISMPAYEIPAPNLLASFTYDLNGGQYVLVTHTADTGGYTVGQPRPSSYFTPDAMAGGGVR
jgi:Protein of unknown function (DUF1329)